MGIYIGVGRASVRNIAVGRASERNIGASEGAVFVGDTGNQVRRVGAKLCNKCGADIRFTPAQTHTGVHFYRSGGIDTGISLQSERDFVLVSLSRVQPDSHRCKLLT